ncbi:MAG TPA: hypothetical protein VHO90_17295 [Bacteroidales bacterium]|nr:hypothetical protein [Bacteroidales bacterium]
MIKFAPVFQAYISGMKQIISTLFFLGAIPFFSIAQSNGSFSKPAILNELQSKVSGEGTVEIVQEHRIDDLLARHLEFNRRSDGIVGYRILIFKASYQNSRDKAFEEKSRFVSAFPNIPVYYFYEQPESRLFVGDFRTKSEATRMKLEIEKMFKNAIVIETKINFPNLDKTEDRQ